MFGLLGDLNDLGVSVGTTEQQLAKQLKQQYRKGKMVKSGKTITVNFKSADPYTGGMTQYGGMTSVYGATSGTLIPMTIKQTDRKTGTPKSATLTAPYDLFFTNQVDTSTGTAQAYVIPLTTGGTCSYGYVMGANGQCIPSQIPCPTGYTMSATGQCVPGYQPNQCPSGTDMYGNCLTTPSQTCPTGYVMSAYGQCTPSYGPTTGGQYYSQGQLITLTVSQGSMLTAPAAGYQYINATTTGMVGLTQVTTTAPYALTVTGRVLYYGGQYLIEVSPQSQQYQQYPSTQACPYGQDPLTFQCLGTGGYSPYGYGQAPGTCASGYIMSAGQCVPQSQIYGGYSSYGAQYSPYGYGMQPSSLYQMQTYAPGMYVSPPSSYDMYPAQLSSPQMAQPYSYSSYGYGYGEPALDTSGAAEAAEIYGASADDMGLPSDYQPYSANMVPQSVNANPMAPVVASTNTIAPSGIDETSSGELAGFGNF